MTHAKEQAEVHPPPSGSGAGAGTGAAIGLASGASTEFFMEDPPKEKNPPHGILCS